MSRTTTRRLAAAAAILLIAGIAAWWGYDAGRTSGHDAVARDTANAPLDAPQPRVAPRSRPDPARAAADAAPAESANSATAPTADDDDAAPGELAAVDIDVRRADGRPAAGFTVYALAEGAPGVDDERAWDLVPSAETDGDGATRLRVSRPGVYDVGASDLSFVHALATSVRIPSAERVTITLPPLVLVTVEERGEPPPERPMPLLLGTAEDVPQARLPGRGQFSRATVTVPRQGAGAPCVRVPQGFPLGAAFESVYLGRLAVAPSRFTAPATVALTWAEQFRVRLELHFEPGDAVWPSSVLLAPTFAWGEGAGRPTSAVRVIVPPQTGLDVLSPADRLVFGYVPRRTGRVTWSGPGIAEGAADFAVPDDASAVTVPITVRVNDLSALARQGAWVRVTAGALQAVERPTLWTMDARGGCDGYDVDLDEREALPPESEWVLATDAGGAIAGPVRVAPGTETALVLAPGGFLVVVPAQVRPAAAGADILRRADGRPIPARNPGEDHLSVDREVAVSAGTLLGPFQPGPLKLHRFAAGGLVGEIDVVVRAGAYEALRLTDRRAR